MYKRMDTIYTLVALILVLALLMAAVAFIGGSEDSSDSTDKKETTAATDSSVIPTKYEEDVYGLGVCGYITISDRTYFYYKHSVYNGNAITVYPSNCVSYSGCEVTFLYSYDKITWNQMIANGSDSVRTEPNNTDSDYLDIYVAYTVVQNCKNPYVLYKDLISNYLTGPSGDFDGRYNIVNYYTYVINDANGDGIYNAAGDSVLG